MALSSYHENGGFNKRKRKAIVKKVIADLKGVDFDAIAVQGVSGLIMGPIVAYLMNKNLVVVRKQGEKSHASQLVESPVSSGKYVILDDFVNSGTTARTIRDAIKKAHLDMELVGGYCWVPGRRFQLYPDDEIKDLNK